MKRLLVLGCVTGLLCAAANGKFIYDGYEQNRSVIAEWYDVAGQSEQHCKNSLETGSFDETTEAVYISPNSKLYRAFSSQDSEILEDRITFSSYCRSYSAGDHAGVAGIEHSACSSLKSGFRIENPCQALFVGKLEGEWDCCGTVGYATYVRSFVHLKDEFGSLLYSVPFPGFREEFHHHSTCIIEEPPLELVPGIYTLEVETSYSVFYSGGDRPNHWTGFGGYISFEDFAMILIPEPATTFLFALGIFMVKRK